MYIFCVYVISLCVYNLTQTYKIYIYIVDSNTACDANPTLPEFRRIYIYIDDDEFRILNQNEFSPQTMSFSSQIPAPNITNVEIKLIARHLTKGSDLTSLQFSPNIALCEIITMSPTLSPSNAPTTPIPTPAPVIRPTTTPSISPTKSPTYNFPIDWCIILIKGTTAYNVTFSIPEYKNDGTTPSINDVKYMINYAQIGRNSIEANKIGTNTITYNELLFTNGININYNTEFKMTTVNNINNDITYAEWTECIVRTMNPTINPSISPTIQPTLSPTNPDVGVFVYSNDEKNSICAGYERCACHLDKFNYDCIGLDFPEEPQIEDTRLYFLPSSGEQKSVLWIGRYQYYFHYDTDIEWEFIYLNDTNNFNSGQRVKPIRGITTIRAEERLGAIVLAEFVPIPNEALDIHDPQWYMFKITNCSTAGLMDNAFKYIEASGGLCSESEYAYTVRNGACKSSTCGTKYDPISSFRDVKADSETSLEVAVAEGPVSIAIEADQSAFQFYSGGVLTGTCGTRLDHGVLAVGYGTSGSKNEWDQLEGLTGSGGGEGDNFIGSKLPHEYGGGSGGGHMPGANISDEK